LYDSLSSGKAFGILKEKDYMMDMDILKRASIEDNKEDVEEVKEIQSYYSTIFNSVRIRQVKNSIPLFSRKCIFKVVYFLSILSYVF